MKFKDAIEEVKRRVNIVDIIKQYNIELKRVGKNYIGLCPFHNERTPSFSVNTVEQMYNCFGCHKGGNVYTFLQEKEGWTFLQAVKYLASKVNITIEDDYESNNETFKKKKLMYQLYKDVANAYYVILNSDIGKQGLDYLINRNLTYQTIKKFGLGYAPKSFGYVYKMMKDKGYDDKFLIESKLFGLGEKGAYDFFYERVMFPLVDMNNNVVSFQGRILGSGDQKYINTSESLIYKKSYNLFGVNYAKLTRSDYYILCEGNMDVITLHQNGFDNAVASWGTAFTTEQANLIKRKVNKVIFSQDTDSAGLKAIAAAYEVCKNAGINETYVLDLNPVKDVDEYINKYGKEEFKKKLDNPIPTFMFLISILRKQYNLTNSYDYEKYINTIVSRLANFENKFVREKYIKDVSEQEKLSYNELSKQVELFMRGNKINASNLNDSIVKIDTNKKYANEVDSNIKVERSFVNILLNNQFDINDINNIIKIDELSDPISIYLYEELLNNKNKSSIMDSLADIDEDKANKIKEIMFSNKDLILNENNIDLKVALIELIKKIKINNLKNINSNSLEEKIEINKKIKLIMNEKYNF